VLRHDSFTTIFTTMKVTIESRKDRLILRWVCPETGKRVSISTSVEDSPTGRAHAQNIKCQIENDVRFGYYDPTLLKYKPRTIGKNATEITTVELFALFTKYQFKQKGLAQSSIKSRYEPLKRMLEKHLNIQAVAVDRRRAGGFADICKDNLTAGTAKARVMLLKSAWDWGKDRYQLSDENPWVGLAERFRAEDIQSPAAFSTDEVKRIIQGFRNSRYYAHYTDYVVFRFGMGTRGGEASATKWKHISSDFRSIWIGESYSRGVTGSTKTKKARTVVMPASIAAMLSARKVRVNPKSVDELVFTTPTGLPIGDRNFCRRAWKTVLAEVGVSYRKPYTSRKTAATLSLLAGENYLEVAAALGHNPHTMHKHYADALQDRSVFLDFE
jgi:integrase